ncbi:hypothetical protein CTAYLR_008946 [Chrysophaeum taylorii]|uniref:Uncharacterized protein n=1 Tax=Chrysophaeum taylorii TaxID=2483200 RepID=A0AAD7UD40_9STRA|nr:hypothetical protein CTAYLR_008946 [Chrysophaeum taylorii]
MWLVLASSALAFAPRTQIRRVAKLRASSIFEDDKVLGVLGIDYDYPPIDGDIDGPNTFTFKVIREVVKGLTFERAQAGYIDAGIKEELARAVKVLEGKGVVGLTGDCGFMMFYQKVVNDLTHLPVFMSSLLQSSLLASSFEEDERVAIFTANSTSLEPAIPELLGMCGIRDDKMDQFYVVGCQDIEGFDAVAKGQAVNTTLVNRGIKTLLAQQLEQNPKTRAALIECTELPFYGNTFRRDFNLTTFDAVTLANFFYSSRAVNTNFNDG